MLSFQNQSWIIITRQTLVTFLQKKATNLDFKPSGKIPFNKALKLKGHIKKIV